MGRLRVAVLGSNSFIGSDLVDLILDETGSEVLGLSRSPEKAAEFLAYAPLPRAGFTFVRADLNDDLPRALEALDAFEPEFVVNLSAQGDVAASWTYPADFFRTNNVALAGLLDALKGRTYLRGFLHASSSSVYAPSDAPIAEDARLGPLSPYGVSKAAADLLLDAYRDSFGFPAQIVRPPNVYGPHQSLFRIIPKTVVALKRGERIELHGGGHALRQYLHVRDLTRAMLALLERGEPGVYNVAPDDSVRVRDIVAAVCDLSGVEFEAATRTVEDRRTQQSGQFLDSTKIRNAVGWQPRYDIRSGVRTVYEWIERDWHALADADASYVHQT